MKSQDDQVFHLSGDKLTPMPARPMREGLFGKTLEDALQTMLEKYPQVIPGKQIDPASDDPPRFVLLRREMPVGGWSLDHLFVDQRGILTLVETKLFQNPESRREVIGQVIEYASNALEYWGGGLARQKATEFWANHNPPADLDELLSDGLGLEIEIEDFWKIIEGNLKNGKIRLVIASDELRPEMRRMIEYLNSEMQNAELFGLELKCYGDSTESLVMVPRLVGQTQFAIDKKSSGKATIKWTADKLKQVYQGMDDQVIGQRLQKVLDWALQKNIFMLAVAMNPGFGLRSKTGERLASFYSAGEFWVYLNERSFQGGIEERDSFAQGLKELRLFDQNLNPSEVISNRACRRRIQDLDEDELKKLLDLLGQCCG